MQTEQKITELVRHLWNTPEEVKRREEVSELVDMYTNCWKDQLVQRIHTLFSPQTAELLYLKANTSLNILKWVSDELSQIYAEAPLRSLVAKSGDDTPPSSKELEEALEWYESGGKLNLALDRAAKLTFACREVLIRPHVKNKKLSLEILTPDKVMVIPDPHDYTETTAVLVKLDERSFALWTKETFYELDLSLNTVHEEPNKYGRIPYLVCHASFPVDHFWHHFESNALKEATLAAGVGMTDHSHLRHLQSFKQIWVRTDSLDTQARTMLLDPAGVVELRGQSDIGVLDVQADLEKHLASILDQAGSVLALYGIRPEQLQGTLDASSGYALSIKLLGTIKAWKAQRRVWEVWERELYDLVQVVAKKNHLILPVAKLEIEYRSIIGEDLEEPSHSTGGEDELG